MTTLETLLAAAGAYLALGVLFAIPFVFFGVGRVDPDAQAGSWGFRALIFPGAVLLWPLLAKRWFGGSGVPLEKTPHKRIAAERSGGRA